MVIKRHLEPDSTMFFVVEDFEIALFRKTQKLAQIEILGRNLVEPYRRQGW